MKSLTIGKSILLALGTVGLIAVIAWGYLEGRAELEKEKQRERPVNSPTRVVISSGDTVVKMDDQDLKISGVALGPLAEVRYRHSIEAFGTVLDTQDLVELRGNLENAQAQLRRAHAAQDNARWEFEREKKLGGEKNVVSAETVQKAEAALLVEDATTEAAESALDTLKINARHRYGEVLGKALLEDSPEFERLRQRQAFLIQITLPAGMQLNVPCDRAIVHSPQTGDIEATFYAEAPRTDSRLQGRSLYFFVDASQAWFAPGLSVAASLPVGGEKKGVLVPESSVVWLHGKPWVYLQIKPDEFARREISTEEPVRGGWAQPEEFGRSALIVIQSPQVLLSEEFRSQISVGEEAEGK